MLRLDVCFSITRSGEHFSTNIARKFALVSWLFPSLSFRLTTVHLPLVTEHVILASETFATEFARKPSLFVRVNSTSGRMVTLIMRVQLVDGVMVTVADLTHDVTTVRSLKRDDIALDP